MSRRNVFIINFMLGLWASIKHIGALYLYHVGKYEFEGMSMPQIYLLTVADFILVFGSVLTLINREAIKIRVLSVHAVVLGLISIAIFVMLFRYTLIGIPKWSLGWMPGVMAGFVGYSVMVIRLALYRGNNMAINGVGWYAAGITFAFELLIMYRFYVGNFT